ncbi:MAG: DUF1385 domain-containing protein [Anaerolineales bacterium]|nr:DUF1385 domain-containing protein [Anaerolineales bacterium]
MNLNYFTNAAAEPLPFYGGQAVIEGVMMRGRRAMAIAVRAPDQRIVIHTQPLNPIYHSAFSRIPFLRGLLGLWDALGLGWQSLNYSARIAGGEEVKFEGPAAWGTIALSLVFAIAIFSVGPTTAAYWTETALGLPFLAVALTEGTLQLTLLIGYLWAIGQVAEIRRVFAYHGAEHQTIHAFEAGAELTPASAARFPLEHPRCGTAFILNVAALSIFLFALLGPLPLVERILSRFLLIPVVAAIAFEYQRFTARHIGNPLVCALIAPSLALQRLTTRRPDEKMLEVAIAAFKAMREEELSSQVVG